MNKRLKWWTPKANNKIYTCESSQGYFPSLQILDYQRKLVKWKDARIQRDLLPCLEIPNHCPIPTFTLSPGPQTFTTCQILWFTICPIKKLFYFSSSFHLPSQLSNPCSPDLLPPFVHIIPLLNCRNCRNRYLTVLDPLVTLRSIPGSLAKY